MKFISFKMLVLFFAVFPIHVLAAVEHCSNVVISDVLVEGARDDNLALAEKLVIRLQDTSGNYVQCHGKDYLHLENTAPAYTGMLSIALTAQTTGKVVQVAVNTSVTTVLSNQLAFIRILPN